MEITLNSARVPESLRSRAEEIAKLSVVDEPVFKWRDEPHEFILLGMTAGRSGSSQNLDSQGRPVGAPEDATKFVMMGIEDELRRLIREFSPR